MDENDIIVKNKARLVAQGFNQEEGIDYEETFVSVARLEAIRMLLEQLLNHVFKLKKALCGLKQSPRAWYERLSKFLLENGFKIGKINITLFIKTKEKYMLLIQIYVDDIIFGATNVSLCEKISKCMHSEFEMSMIGELNFFLGLQIKQLKEETFFNQAK